MRVTIYDLVLAIIDSPLQTLTLRPKSPVFKLRFHNSNSRLSQPSNNNGPSLSTRPLYQVSANLQTPAPLLQHVLFLARYASLVRALPWRFATCAYQRLRLIVALATQDLRVCGSGGGSYYVKIQDHLRDHRGCLECSDLIQRLS